MSGMKQPSRRRIRNLNPFGHGGSPQYEALRVDGEETSFVSLKLLRPGSEPQILV